MIMTDAGSRPEPGSFYRHTLAVIQAAHPNREAAWQRAQAREVMDSVAEERERLVPDDDLHEIAPMYPRTPEDLANLEQDFQAGERAGEVEWRTSSSSADRRKSVEVAHVSGIICIRRGGDPSAAMYLTKPDWRVFARRLEDGSAVTDLTPQAAQVLDQDFTPAEGRELRATVDALVVPA
jgi:ribonuclease D